MALKLRVGDRWGRLKCTGFVQKDHVFDSGDGVQGIFENELHYVITCDCGKVMEVYTGDFKNRKTSRDCGCGLALEDDAVVLMSVTVPTSVRRMLKEYAREHTNSNVSGALAEIVRKIVESTSNGGDNAEG